MAKKTFNEKLKEDKGFPKVQPLTAGMKKRFGEGTILLPSAKEIFDLMQAVPQGKVMTVNQIRVHLAQRHNATMACPIVTGIYARIVAGAAGEDLAAGKKRVVPFCRTVKSKGDLNPKYPGGVEEQQRLLEAEGVMCEARGKRVVVCDFERFLMNNIG